MRTMPAKQTVSPEWDEFLKRMDWRQGEHVTIIGPTGQGKTTLARALLPAREYCIIVATKPKDKVLNALRRKGWHVITEWPPEAHMTKVILWPRTKRGDTTGQKKEIETALISAYEAGGWCILIDELRHVTDFLKLKDQIEILWQQGRSLNVSLVTCNQRPSHIPLLAYDQATHLFLYGDKDETNIKRMGGLGYWDKKEIMEAVSQLPRYSFLYLNTRTGTMEVGTVPRSEVT